MDNVIYVEPMADEWVVRGPNADDPAVYASGAKAEAAAIQLASRLARLGHPSQVIVYMRGGALAGRFLCPADGPMVVEL